MLHRLCSRGPAAAGAGAAALGLALVIAGPASAEPDRTAEPSGLPATIPAEVACPFPVTIELAEPSGQTRQELGNGTELVKGTLVVTLTNDDTGETIERDVSGPVFFEDGGNLVRLQGRSLLPVFEGNDPDGLAPTNPGLFVVTGRVIFENFVLTAMSGKVEDICQTLAG